ncbi:MAG: sel1 repeat family protein [Bacteroidetes bacterium]|nr:sel1 repeat family protein [Bacteroidota bacterium]
MQDLSQQLDNLPDNVIEEIKRDAESGDPEAQWLLGDYYLRKKTNPEYQKALEWSLKSAKNGNANAMLNLASIYENGVGIKESQETAIMFLIIAEQFDIENDGSVERLKGHYLKLVGEDEFNRISVLAEKWKKDNELK